MADRIASLLFDNALVLVPLVVAASVALAILLIRRWPHGVLRRAASTLLIAVLLVVATGASALLYAERNIRSIIQHRIEVLTLQPRSGAGPHRVADLRGNVVLVNFWATWCLPCRDEMPDLNKLAARYASRRVAILTITDEEPDRVALFERKVLPLRTMVAKFDSDRPNGALAAMAYQGRPTTVILDRDGRVRDILIGRQSYERLNRAIEKNL